MAVRPHSRLGVQHGSSCPSPSAFSDAETVPHGVSALENLSGGGGRAPGATTYPAQMGALKHFF